MLGAIRKFSSSIYAKILLFVVAIPFVFWGMGPVFQGGKQNTIAQIGKEKISTQEFVNFVKYNHPSDEMLNKNSIQKLLSSFIGNKLISLEIESLDIKLSDKALSKIIRSEKMFKRENKFSRTEYEKFLIKNNLSAAAFEANILEQFKKDQLFDFVGGGIVPASFLVESSHNQINQKRNIEVINLNNVYKEKLNFTNSEIENYYTENSDNFKIAYRTIKFVELNPKNLIGSDEFNDLFFKKLDEIDDHIVGGKNLNFLTNQFNLVSSPLLKFNELDIKNEPVEDNNFPKDLLVKVFSINENEPTVLIEHKDKYFIIELIKNENILSKISEKSVKKEILKKLSERKKRRLISELISKINTSTFGKEDFYKFSEKENAKIQKFKIEGKNDSKSFKLNLVKQIYSHSEKRVILVADIALSEIFLIYIDKIENVLLGNNSENYEKYFNLSKAKLSNNLYNTYDLYLKKKYEISINYKALDKVHNYFE
tara:strand:+ start:1355 stop:2803 length:1449 start_codon:yes stop_codon:yes gene_type:complete